MKIPYQFLIMAAGFLWIGFVGAISFMEAWLKFRAPGITVPLGLGIGRIVFNALNKVEWCLAIIILISLLLNKGVSLFRTDNLFYLIPVLILILQTFWLLPALDARAELHIQGTDAPASNLHFVYVGLELLKISSLSAFGILLYKIMIR